MGKRRSHSDEKVGDMTPMIDVTFLLLIFFLVSIKFKSLDAKMQIEMPTSFGSQNTGEVEKPKLAIDLDIVEPGMVVYRTPDNREVQDWLHPKEFLTPPTVVQWFRGTRLEDREAQVALSGRPIGSKPPGIKRAPSVNWDFEEWAREYQNKVFKGVSGDFMQVAYDAALRSPVRIVRYKVREQEPGNADRTIAVCYSVEELQFLMSELYWKYYRREMNAGIRDRDGNPPPDTDKLRFDEYKRKSPALVIKTGESTVLQWAEAKTGTPVPLLTDKRRALVYKPKFGPYWLAEMTCVEKGDAISATLNRNPRTVASFYDIQGWNVQYVDVTEVLDMLNDNIIIQEIAGKADNSIPAFQPDKKLSRNPAHVASRVFLEQTFAGDSSVGVLEAKFTDPNLCTVNKQPFGVLKRPGS